MLQQLFDISLKIKHLKQSLLAHVKITEHCMLCADRADQAGLCLDCLTDMPWHDGIKCHVCNLASQHSICGNCLNTRPHFDHTVSVFRYAYPVNHLIQRYKYQEALHINAFFAEQLLKALEQDQLKLRPVDVIMPMPIHPQRLRARGFNQALEIAKKLSVSLNIPIDYHSSQRVINAPPQASLPLKKRQANVAGVFTCKTSLQGLHVAVIDDVMTTGASLNEFARILKEAGAKSVQCWVMARTLPASGM